jgi:hypothetical protein
MSIYDSIIKDDPDSPIDFSKLDFKKLQTPLKFVQSGRELSAGGQNTGVTATKSRMIDHFSIYDSINL